MSNYLAIATVTATLRNLLQNVLNDKLKQSTLTNATVLMVRPEDLAKKMDVPAINIYLYQVTPNAAWRNEDLPTRRADGSFSQRACVALDLHYLFSFYGDEASLEPQRLLGLTTSFMHTWPVLTHSMITSATQSLTFLSGSNLADDVELVRFSPLHLSLEDLSKIWSVFFQVQYALSVAYQGTVVLIAGDDLPHSALPARQHNLNANPMQHFNQPFIEHVSAQTQEGMPERFGQIILADSVLLLRGQRLQGPTTTLLLNGSISLPAQSVSNIGILCPLNEAQNIHAGVQGIQVIHQFAPGTSPTSPRSALASNIASFVLRPSIAINSHETIANDKDLHSATITLTVDPPVGKLQRVVLLLNQLHADLNAQAYTFERAQPEASAPDVTEKITFTVTGVKRGTYLVRIQVDGAESVPEVDKKPFLPGGKRQLNPKFNMYTGQPQVTLS